MPILSYKYTVTYENGTTRTLDQFRSGCIEISDEDYLKIVKGISDGFSFMEIPGIDSILESMRKQVTNSDPYENLNGKLRTTPLKKPRKIQSIEFTLEPGFIRHIQSYADPVAEMNRPEQVMTIYRSDGSSVEFKYKHGEVRYRDSRSGGSTHIMTADSFLKFIVL